MPFLTKNIRPCNLGLAVQLNCPIVFLIPGYSVNNTVLQVTNPKYYICFIIPGYSANNTVLQVTNPKYYIVFLIPGYSANNTVLQVTDPRYYIVSEINKCKDDNKQCLYLFTIIRRSLPPPPPPSLYSR